MTKIEQMLDRLHALPQEAQDEFADLMLDLLDEELRSPLSPAEIAEIERRRDSPGKTFSHDEVIAMRATRWP